MMFHLDGCWGSLRECLIKSWTSFKNVCFSYWEICFWYKWEAEGHGEVGKTVECCQDKFEISHYIKKCIPIWRITRLFLLPQVYSLILVSNLPGICVLLLFDVTLYLIVFTLYDLGQIICLSLFLSFDICKQDNNRIYFIRI